MTAAAAQAPAKPRPGSSGAAGAGSGTCGAAEVGLPLTVTVPRVLMRMYRRSRTSANIMTQMPHFEYAVRCEWGAEEGARSPQRWWDGMPPGYTLHRRWGDVVRFHELIAGMAFDSEHGIPRVKAKMPELPHRADLDKFLQGVAATGDTLALARRNPPSTGRPGDPWDELDVLHTIYVENRLGPYFEELNRVIWELPSDMIQDSPDFRKFVTSGSKCRPRDRSELGPAKERFCGPVPHRAAPEDLVAATRALLARDISPLKAQLATGAVFRPCGFAQPTPKAGAASAPLPPPPPRGSIPPSSPDGTNPAPPARSASAPGLAAPEGALDGLGGSAPASPAGPRLERRRQRLASSHYGFFATTMRGAQDTGYSSQSHFWKRMVVKERAELGRRTRLRPPAPEERASPGAGDGVEGWRDVAWRRLPELPPPVGSDAAAAAPLPSGAPRGGHAAAQRPKPQAGRCSLALLAPAARPPPPEAIARDIAEGFRVILLGDRPPLISRNARKEQPLAERVMATRGETLSVYTAFRTMHKGAAGGGAGFESSDEDEADDGRPEQPAAQAAVAELASRSFTPLRWPVLLAWAQQKEDFAVDFRHRSVCAALNRALRLWMQSVAAPEERSNGVSLTHLFRWIWPDVSCEHVATMLTWVCLKEIGKIRYATPRVIDQDQRTRLENMFHNMDADHKGHCNAKDISGGNNLGVEAKLKNIVDAETVRAVCGDRAIHEIEFLELMCEDGFRAHFDAQQVVLRDGNKLTRQSREVAGETIWVLQDPPAWERPQRQLIDAIEGEIKRWRRLAVLEAANLQPLDDIGDDDDAG